MLTSAHEYPFDRCEARNGFRRVLTYRSGTHRVLHCAVDELANAAIDLPERESSKGKGFTEPKPFRL